MSVVDSSGNDEYTDILPSRDGCIYTKSYCEENVWKLCEYIRIGRPQELRHCYAIFISNPNETVPIWQQTASKSPHQPVVWDYHVIFIHKDEQCCSVYDLDTRLSFPCTFDDYVARSIQPDELFESQFHRLFRVVPGLTYLETFASDRSHMMKEDQSWMAPPPEYPCISTKESKNNIRDFISMDATVGVGEVMNTRTFADYFGEARLMITKYFEYKRLEEQTVPTSSTEVTGSTSTTQ